MTRRSCAAAMQTNATTVATIMSFFIDSVLRMVMYTLRANGRTEEFQPIWEDAALGDFRRRGDPRDDVHPDGEPRVFSAAAGHAEGSGGIVFADGPVYRNVWTHRTGDEPSCRNYCGADRREARSPDGACGYGCWISEPRESDNFRCRACQPRSLADRVPYRV